MSRTFALWLALAVLAGAGGVFLGRAIKGAGEPAFAFDTEAPAYSAADLPLGRSRAGFTGFAETGGLDGRTIVAGKVSSVTAESITLETSAGATTIRVTGEQKLRALVPYQVAIAPGTTVVIIKAAGSDEASSVLALLDP